MNSLFVPGMLVRHAVRTEWGLGQIQSNIDGKLTVNFENRGKVVLVGDHIDLVPQFEE